MSTIDLTFSTDFDWIKVQKFVRCNLKSFNNDCIALELCQKLTMNLLWNTSSYLNKR